MNPCSKKASFEDKDNYFVNFYFELHDIYRTLNVFNSYKKDLILNIHNEIKVNYGRDFANVFYDVTNYYFEIPNEDDFRKEGYSKENRPSSIINLGLLMDNSGIPVSYELFEGNVHDSSTLMPSLHSLKDDFNLGRVIVVADKAMNSGENIAYNILNNDGYIFSQTVRGASSEVKEFVLDNNGYVHISEGFKIKSRIVPTEIYVTNMNGKRKKVLIDQKQVAFYSKKYDEKAKYDRQRAINKACKLLKRGTLSPPNSAYKYIKSDFVDMESCEIFKVKDFSFIDEQRIKEEERFDGYYLIISSELEMDDYKIVEAYRGLWKIEESFKITKSILKSRPVFLSTKERIEAHFLICFVSLVILRLLEKELEDVEISIGKVIDEMRNITGTYVDQNYYMFDYFNDNVKKLGEIIGVDFSKRFMTTSEINDIISNVKKDK